MKGVILEKGPELTYFRMTSSGRGLAHMWRGGEREDEKKRHQFSGRKTMEEKGKEREVLE